MNEKYLDDYYLAEILVQDFTNRISLLKIPLQALEPGIAKILKELLDNYRKNNTLVLKELSQATAKAYIDLYTANDYECFGWENKIPYYENRIFARYKKDFTLNLMQKLDSGEIDYKQFTAKVDEINSYELSDKSTFKTVSELNTNDEDKVYVKSDVIRIDREIKGFALGELSVWSGGNASAKSTFLGQMALESINQSCNVAIYSGELTSQRLISWLLLQAAGKRNVEEKNGFYKPTEAAKQKILYWLDHKLYVYENSFGNKAKYIISSIKKCIEKNNIKVVIIDNLMSLDINDYGDNKYDTQSYLIKELSELAKKYQVHIHFVCHPRKSTTFLRKVDISGTADITNVADNVFILHRVNNDFKRATKDMFGWKEDHELYKFSNIIEICKSREFGVQDCFVGLYFEKETRRLLNGVNENLRFGWEMMR